MKKIYSLLVVVVFSAVSFASNSHLKERTNIQLHYSQSPYHFDQDFIIEHFGFNNVTPR